MKKVKLSIIILAIFLLASCRKEAQSSETLGNDFQVEFLFEKDGIKMYRFYDGQYHYFTDRGETISTVKHGKTTYSETIN